MGRLEGGFRQLRSVDVHGYRDGPMREVLPVIAHLADVVARPQKEHQVRILEGEIPAASPQGADATRVARMIIRDQIESVEGG